MTADRKSKGHWLKFGSYAAVAGIVKESDTAKTADCWLDTASKHR